MKRTVLAAFLSLVSMTAYTAQIQEETPNPDVARIVRVDPTPEPDNVSLCIQFPKDREVKKGNPVNVQMKLEGYSVGTNSEFPRSREIFNDKEGQSVHVIVDNYPYLIANEAIIDALDDNEDYYEQTFDIDIPFSLSPGMHIIRAFPVRSFNESLKGDGCLASSIFYIKTQTEDSSMDLSAPYLIYNEPQGEYDYKKNTPLLLDFYIANCQLSKDGYKVRLTIDHKIQRTVTEWTPYYIYDLSRGTHTIRLELLDAQNQNVKGPLGVAEQTIILK